MRCGLLGQTLGHSYSPQIHAALSQGSYDYQLFEVQPENLAAFMTGSDFDGLNVTIPYKQQVVQFCAQLTPVAQKIGSVNTIARLPDGSLIGHNTDALGFDAMLGEGDVRVEGKKVLVLGSGGASLCVRYILELLGAGQVITISRQGQDNYRNIERHSDAQIIVNTTPVGMYPDTSSAPIDLAGFSALECVLDLIYNPARTRLMLQAQQLGIPSVGGLAMLVGQARGACELFLGGKPVPAEKEQAVLARMRRRMENIVLVGMPGCGKSTVGKAVAHRLGREFVDSDDVIEQQAGMPIPEIFEREGQEGFRARESAVLAQLGGQSGLVIATGGGCVTRWENYYHLRQNGCIVFLERELDELERQGRPLSLGANLGELYQRRGPLYRKFAGACAQNNAPVQDVVERILHILGGDGR